MTEHNDRADIENINIDNPDIDSTRLEPISIAETSADVTEVSTEPALAQAVFTETEKQTVPQVAIDPTIAQSVSTESPVAELHQLEEPVMESSLARTAKRSLLGPVIGTLAALGLVSGGVWAATRADEPLLNTGSGVVNEVVDPTIVDTVVVTDTATKLVKEPRATVNVTDTATDVVVIETDVVKETVTAPRPTVTVTDKATDVVVVETDVVKETVHPTVTDTTIVEEVVAPRPTVTVTDTTHVQETVTAVPLPAPAPIHVEDDANTVTVTG